MEHLVELSLGKETQWLLPQLGNYNKSSSQTGMLAIANVPIVLSSVLYVVLLLRLYLVCDFQKHSTCSSTFLLLHTLVKHDF